MRIGEIMAPTLIVWGVQDRIIPVSHAHIGHKMIANSQSHIFNQCGHIPQIEKAEEFNRLVMDFLAWVDNNTT